MSDIEELIKLEPYKSCYECGEMQGRADAIDEAIAIVKNSYRMDALEKLEQLKGHKCKHLSPEGFCNKGATSTDYCESACSYYES